jgi:hypothetical protein
MAIISNHTPAKIGGFLGAGKHKQGSRKLSRVSGRIMVAWLRLPTATRGSSEKGIGRRRRWELRRLTAGEFGMQKERVPVADGAKQQGEGDKAGSHGNYCGGEVAAGE